MVSYEIGIKVYAPDNIGYLVDNLLKLKDLTIKGFEWQPLNVTRGLVRKRILRKKLLSRVWRRARDYASRSA